MGFVSNADLMSFAPKGFIKIKALYKNTYTYDNRILKVVWGLTRTSKSIDVLLKTLAFLNKRLSLIHI